MTDSSPSLEDWRALYLAAVAFKKAKLWDWMYDTDMFGVQDPETRQIGYCCIMGNLGERFALAVYLGSEGLLSYLRILSNADESDDSLLDDFVTQTCLIASFEDRSDLEKADVQTIRRLGLKFRGRAAWPMFRSHNPGFLPRPVTRAQARFLVLALQQAAIVAHRLKEDEDLLVPPRDKVYLVRVPKRTKGALTWRDRWLEPAPFEKGPVTVPHVDELRLKRIKKTAQPSDGILEAHFFYGSFIISGEEGAEGPFHPLVFLFVDHGSGMVLGVLVSQPWDYESKFQERFLGVIEEAGLLPEEVLVKKPEAFFLLKPLTDALGVKLTRVDKLESLEQARIAMSRYMASSGSPNG